LFQPHNTGGQKIPISVHESAGCDTGGFTLIEIIVVISLIALMLVFSFPQLSGFLAVNNRNKAVRWMISQRTVLSTKAVKEQTPYVLRVDISGNRIVTMSLPLPGAFPSGDAGMCPAFDTASSGQTARNTFVCGGDLAIAGVMFPDGETINAETADIVFSEKGYCDRAIIHMKDGGSRFSIYIEPFLPRVTVYDGYIKFGQRWGDLS
jgi:prepilin-type N-terminal cleavage/methylation domain-containing protein